MQAIEFVTKAKAGKMIEIPEEYIKEISGEFRVILLLDKNIKETKSPKKQKFNALKIETKNFNFDRNEIYDE